MTVGVFASRTFGEAAESLGFALDPGDPVAQVNALVAWINQHGGVAGRELAVEWHFRDDTSNEPLAVKYQAACEDLTNDKEVYAVLTVYGGGPMGDCLAERDHTLIETNGAQFADSVTYRRRGPYYFTPGMMAGDRYAAAVVDGVDRQGYFDDPLSQHALVYSDTPVERRIVDEVVEPALAERGVTVADRQAVQYPSGASDSGETYAQYQNAALRFKTRGITHVLFATPVGGPLGFAFAARQADYHPTYGLGTYGVPFVFADTVPDQARQSVAVGFMPVQDVHQAHVDGPVSQRETLCRRIMEDAGLSTGGDIAWLSMATHCDVFFFFKEAMDRATDLAPTGLAAAAESMGDSYMSPVNYAVRIAPDQHDGPLALRPLAFFDDCGCFKYAGDPYRGP